MQATPNNTTKVIYTLDLSIEIISVMIATDENTVCGMLCDMSWRSASTSLV